MDPIPDRAGADPNVDQPPPEPGLIDLLDEALVRLDGLRDRPRISMAATTFLVFLLAVGWGLSRWRAVEPIDDGIPGVDQMTVTEHGSASAPDDTVAGVTTVPPSAAVSSTVVDTAPEILLVIHVSGAVIREGLVEVPAGGRLADAIAAAGGATSSADIHRLNLATPLIDGMHIRVPEVGEDGAAAERPLIETARSGGGPSDPAGDQPGAEPVVVNINRADVTELQRLPGVGPAIAGAIVTWRDDNGLFTSIEDLLDVPGIGPAKLAAIEDQVSL